MYGKHHELLTNQKQTGNHPSEHRAQIIAMFAFNLGVMVFVIGAPFGPPLVTTGLLIIIASSWMLIRIEYSAADDRFSTGLASQVVWSLPSSLPMIQRKMRLSNAHWHCAIPRACARPALIIDVRAGRCGRGNLRQRRHDTTVVGVEALKLHWAKSQLGGGLAAIVAGHSPIGGTL